jgi:hypothetical protein
VNPQTGDGQSNAAWTTELQSLSSRTSTTVVATVTAPTNTGLYWLIATADDYDSKTEEGAVDEADEDNNDGYTLGRKSYSILRVGPDMTTSLAGTNSLYASSGKTIQIEAVARNVGGDPATGITNILQLSSGSTLTNVATNMIANLSGYSAQTNTFSFQSPDEPGIYYIRVQINEPAFEAFKDKDNTSDIVSLYVGPDLTVSFTETNTRRVMAGATAKTYVDISNTGSGFGITVENVLQLSTNNAFTTFSAVATNTVVDSTINEPFRFKAPREPGTYYLRAQTDPRDLISEFDEGNNFSEIIMLKVNPLSMPWLNLLLD